MEHAAFHDPALTIALAAAAGMLAQTVLGANGLARAGCLGLTSNEEVNRLFTALVEGRRHEIAAGLREAGWVSANPSRHEERL